ncbi:CDP-alcohol phosphatidyltransferase family protein [Yersinia nurmii]|uniref:CDP-alcohol phosphatidyltransferase family protein n=1 Tax=Yersinia nurmii TaxID=685706 RepID=A0AAW7JUW5_9GAMM|nr:CDP-alcohol phosphatidyltransferase family protein [Yersinia nurmii]MDN0086753.1 CDP-alcohol phosphatidyltransferase family protein [Yersinia nurmii]
MNQDIKDRRPIRARNTAWATTFARILQQRGATPNGISLFSILFSALAGFSFFYAFRQDSALVSGLLLIVAALMIQARLICNLLDGMVAVEGGLRSPVGAVYNDLPDRISDTLILIGVGYGLTAFTDAITLSWAAALFAAMTAYVRVLGGSCGLDQQFSGPMAKQHRMALLTLGTVIAAVVPAYNQWILYLCLWVIGLGAIVTAILRTRAVMNELQRKELPPND